LKAYSAEIHRDCVPPLKLKRLFRAASPTCLRLGSHFHHSFFNLLPSSFWTQLSAFVLLDMRLLPERAVIFQMISAASPFSAA